MERWLESLYTDGTSTFLRPSYPKLNQNFKIYIRVIKDNPIKKMYLRTSPEGEELLTEMLPCLTDDFFVWYRIQVSMVPKVLNYRFKIVCEDGVYWYNADGVFRYTPTDETDFKVIADFSPPKWLEDRVFYQIFPDTFCNEPDPSINHNTYTYLGKAPRFRSWDEPPGEYKESHSMDFFGGNLKGIESKISYLKKLGVNALYLNPIFEAPSNHRYDVQDYFKIDPHIGTNEQFAELVSSLHRQGIRIILDGVFNHSGIACRWFNKENYYKEAGAYQSMQSPFAEFYTFMSHPDKYYCWLTVNTLPKLNYRSQKLRDMIYRTENSVVRYWLSSPYKIDGWRLDVANMLARQKEYQAHREVFREMRQAVKETNPDAYFMGEHFFDATELLEGDALDSVMNYLGFTHPIRQWLSGLDSRKEKSPISTEDMTRQLSHVRSRVSWQIASMQYNLIDCHDMPRLATLVDHPDKRRLAAIMLLTYLGIPSIYYGDETGMNGGISVESTRAPMPWGKQWDQEIWQFYHDLIQLRKKSPALKKGGIKTLWAKGDVYSFARFYGKEIVIVIINRGDEKNDISLDGRIIGIDGQDTLTEYFSNKELNPDTDGFLKISIPGRQGFIFVTKKVAS